MRLKAVPRGAHQTDLRLGDTESAAIGAGSEKADLVRSPKSARDVKSTDGYLLHRDMMTCDAAVFAVAFTLLIRHTITLIVGTANMPPKPNYKHQRAERDRAKKASKDAKLQERKEQAALRKAGGPGGADPSARSGA